MYLDIALIDALTPDGILTSFRVTPKERNHRVVADRYRDIYPEKSNKEFDIGGIRIYNSEDCSILRTDTHLRAFRQINNGYSFQFEHMGIPLCPIREDHHGFYNLIFPPGFRLIDLKIVDPYDENHSDVDQKKEFQHSVIWDKECKVQLIEMELRSNRGSFSFIAKGTFVLVDSSNEQEFINAQGSDWSVSTIINHDDLKDWLKNDGKQCLIDQILEKIDWLELKPNICGFGINFNNVES